MPRRASLRTAALLLALLPLPGSQRTAGPGWSIQLAPAANLWFHGLALLGLPSVGELPLYRPDYLERVVREQPGRSTAFDRSAGYFRQAFSSDSAFEVLHFVPLYFAASGPAALLAALGDLSAPPGPRERFGSAALAAALPKPEERRVLAEFAGALTTEWREYYGATEPPEGAVQRFTAAWRPLETALTPYLERHRLSGGVIFLVPALGPDGRFFEGDPRAANDNVVGVQLPERPAEAVFFVVRELCYPAVRGALAALRQVPTDRLQAERLSGRAAVRCGALLLGRYAPALLADYQAAWLRAAGRSAPFEAAFPLEDSLTRALTAQLAPR